MELPGCSTNRGEFRTGWVNWGAAFCSLYMEQAAV